MINFKLSFLFLASMLFFQICFAQIEKLPYKNAADSFEVNFNAGNFNAIFASFSAEMQAALPFEKTNSFLKSLKQQAGNITNRSFVKYQQTYAIYKTNFETALLSVNISVDNGGKINGLLIKPYKETTFSAPERNSTKLKLPFTEEWDVIWGGDTKKLNYHIDNEAQKNALDLVIKDKKGNSFKTDGKTNEDYYAFGKPLIAPCEGEVVLAVDGIKDNIPGVLNPTYVPGNTVIIKTSNNEYLFFAHFKQFSIVVKQGDKVKLGQKLGLCGNSGNSSEPHLHFHIQNIEDMNLATGIKCYFDKILVNGKPEQDYSPIKNDQIKNL